MAKLRFNWKFALALLLTLTVLAVTAVLTRAWRRSYRAEQGLTLGTQAYQQGQWDQAAQNLGRYLARVNDDVPVLLQYAQANLNIRPRKIGSIQQTIAAYRTILRLEPGNTQAAIPLIDLYLNELNTPGEATLIADKVLAIQDNVAIRISRAKALIRQRSFEDAARELRNVIDDHPDQISAYNVLGNLFREHPDDFPDETPVNYLDQAVANNPDSSLAYINRAIFYLRQGHPDRARTDYDQARQLETTSPQTLLSLAAVAMDLGLLQQTAGYLDTIEERDPANEGLWLRRAQLAQRHGDPQQMRETAEAGLKALGERRWDFLPTAIDLLVDAGQFDRAQQCINELRHADVNVPILYIFEGRIAQQQHRFFAAASCYRKAIANNHNTFTVRSHLADTLISIGDMRGAIQTLREFLGSHPDNHAAHLALGSVLIRNGDYTGAAEQGSLAKQLAPTNLAGHLLYARARLQLLQINETPLDDPAWAEIEHELKRLAEAAPDATPVQLLQIQWRTACQQFQQAGRLLAQLKEKAPSGIQIGLAEANLLQAQGQTAQRADCLHSLIEQFPQESRPVRLLALMLAKSDPDQSQLLLQEAIERIEAPQSQRDLCFVLAALHNARQQPQQALETLQNFSQQWPTDVRIRQALLHLVHTAPNEQAQKWVDEIKTIEGPDGTIWRREQARLWLQAPQFDQHYSQLLVLLKENMRYDPADDETLLLLGAAYQKAQELELAVTTYEQAYERAPDNLNVIVPFVTALNRAQEYVKADRIIHQAAQRKLAHPALSRLKLESFLGQHQIEAGVHLLQSIMQETPENDEVKVLLARLKAQQGQFEQALALLDQTDTEGPAALSADMIRIQIYLAQHKPQKALTRCNQLVTDQHDANAYLIRAQTLIQIGNSKAALADLQIVLDDPATKAPSLLQAGELYTRLNATDQAVKAARQAMDRLPDDLTIKEAGLSILLTAPDTRDQARQLLDEALLSHPAEPGLNVLKARSLLAQGDSNSIEQARRLLEQVTQNTPRHTQAWSLLGTLALQHGQPGEAADLALRGLASSPNDKQLMLLKARAEAVHSPDLAVATLRACHEIYPHDIGVTLELAESYIKVEQPGRAIQLLEPQLEQALPAERPRLQIVLAAARYKTGQKDQATQQLDTLASAMPDSPAPLVTLAKLLAQDQQWGQLQTRLLHWCDDPKCGRRAAKTITSTLAESPHAQARTVRENTLRHLCELEPENLHHCMMIAECLQLDQRFHEACQVYEQVLAKQHDYVVAINNLAWIYCQHLGQHQKALNLANQGLKIKPDYVDLIDTRGVIHSHLGESQKAAEDFARCVQLYPTWAPGRTGSYFHLGQALAELGQTEQATKTFALTLRAHRLFGGLSRDQLNEVHNSQSPPAKGTRQ